MVLGSPSIGLIWGGPGPPRIRNAKTKLSTNLVLGPPRSSSLVLVLGPPAIVVVMGIVIVMVIAPAASAEMFSTNVVPFLNSGPGWCGWCGAGMVRGSLAKNEKTFF